MQVTRILEEAEEVQHSGNAERMKEEGGVKV
jgi:hypothetical protein